MQRQLGEFAGTGRMQTPERRKAAGHGGVSSSSMVPGVSPSAAGGGGGGGGAAAPPSECWDSLSDLESAFHHGFMRSRLKVGDFVYYENPRVTRELDEFCDVDAMHQPKGPIILLGESGIGKSTFLANWLVRRKKMFQNWQSNYPEFIFYHVVGCSRQSLYVSNLLERILREMKEYFELNKEIPDVEERLSWQFPRFLEAASKKGRIILIIDGLQRLRTTDGESILKWVPLAFPPNVRLIFSGTVSNPSTKYMHMAHNIAGQTSPARPGIQSIDQFERPNMNAQLIERIKLEANRRNWTLVSVEPLLEEERWKVLRKFLHKYHPSRMAHEQPPSRAVSADPKTTKALLATHGLQLFDLQQRAIISVPSGSCPHFLKMFLVSLAWAINEGFNIHVLFEQWLPSESIGQLLEAILRTMESGYTPNQQATSDARQFLQENRLTVTADSNHSPNRRNASLSSTMAKKHQQLTSQDQQLSAVNQNLAIPEFTKRGTVGNPRIDLQFNEIQSELTEGVQTGMQRRNSQHEMAEVFVRTLTSRSEAQKNSILGLPLLLSPPSGDSPPAIIPLSKPDPLASPSPVSSLPGSSATLASEQPSCDKHLSRKTVDAMPPYLTGGLYVPPLRELIGRSLCLLYVSRHGLLEKELKFILNAVVAEERQVTESTVRVHRKASFSNVKNISSESPTAFSEADWKALLRALKPLGVLCVQDVLVLPTCKEALRDVIWWRYIGSERAEQQYHQWLIRFFRIHPTTFRRVEELPWHLKRCYQWDALRTVLVNLPMFQLLYTANYKSELFGYWKLLTDGPLPLYSATDLPNCEQLVYAVSFDVVKEYGKSVEEWYKSARPTTKAFTEMIQLITKFMFEFSTYFQGFLPKFNHSPFDLKRLHADGFTFTEDLPHVHHMAASSSSATSGALLNLNANSTPMAMSAAASAAVALGNALESFLALNQQAVASVIQKDKESNGNWFYYYQRWIWIQYPWLALGKEIVLKDNHVEIPVPLRIVKPGGAHAMTSLSSTSSTSPDSSLRSPMMTIDAGDTGGEEIQRDGLGSTTSSTGQGFSTAVQPGRHAKTLQFDQRFWDVKRSMFEPVHQRQKGTLSPAKMRGLEVASTLGGPTPSIPTEDVISPENLFRKKSTYAAVKTVLASSVRTLPGTSASTSALPSVPELDETHGAPTFITEPANASIDKHQGPLDTSLSGITVSRSGLGTRDQLMLEQLTGMDSIASLSTAFGLPAHFQDYPQSEWDLRKSYNYELVLKLQTMYDNTKLEVKKKQSHLQSVKQKIVETQKRYEFTMRECEMAKNAIDEMHLRMDKIEQMLRQIDKQEKTHRKLLRSCEMFPPTDPSHFDTLKKELKVLQMKLKDLVEEKKMLETKKSHLQTVEVPVLQREIERSKQLMSAVVTKLERAREKIAHDQAATEKLYQRRLELIGNVRNTSAKETARFPGQEQVGGSVTQQTNSASTRSLAAKVALQQCEAMCEKIQKATGFSKLELILEKFVSREELNRSFEEQARVYEARLKQIKLHQAELEQQLQMLETSHAATSNEDPRMLEEKLRVAEVELARTERTQNVLLTTSKEVIAGASRIVKLMGITSCRTPHQNAIPAAQLWPPPIDGETALASDFDTLEAKEIANLLEICQDRAGLMLDVIEGGRGDPDADFTTGRPVHSRGRRPKAARTSDESNSKPTGRSKQSTHGGAKRDRGGDRASLLGVSVLGGSHGVPSTGNPSGIPTSMHESPGTPELDEDEKNLEVVTRDAIKVASKAKLSQKKRTKDAHMTPTEDHD